MACFEMSYSKVMPVPFGIKLFFFFINKTKLDIGAQLHTDRTCSFDSSQLSLRLCEIM